MEKPSKENRVGWYHDRLMELHKKGMKLKDAIKQAQTEIAPYWKK